ncbi:unnamed protein product [Somion occarium]|uniref:Rpr2-domain-containing protein n=1 Tax=Somion occarium TaxID=3059160 RepID=A0ABP1DEY4_9APHY
MAKKQKDDVPNPNNVTNREILQRMNFLYQAGALLNHIEAGSSKLPTESPEPPAASNHPTAKLSRKAKKQDRSRKRHPNSCEDLSRNYIQSMKAIGLKTTVRLDPTVKRTLCKKCNIVLIPGSTASIRVNTSQAHGNAVVYTCLSCKNWRRIPAPPVLSPQDAEALVASSAPTQAAGEDAMAIDSGSKATVTPESIVNVPRKKRRRSRLAPLFERKVGHVIFRGNERLFE